MNEDRIKQLAQDIYNSVFNMLDIEPELTAYDCGLVAMIMEKEFLAAAKEHLT